MKQPAHCPRLGTFCTSVLSFGRESSVSVSSNRQAVVEDLRLCPPPDKLWSRIFCICVLQQTSCGQGSSSVSLSFGGQASSLADECFVLKSKTDVSPIVFVLSWGSLECTYFRRIWFAAADVSLMFYCSVPFAFQSTEKLFDRSPCW